MKFGSAAHRGSTRRKIRLPNGAKEFWLKGGGWIIKALEDRIASAFFFFVAILVMIESLNLSFGDVHNPGPGFVPFFLGLSMAVLSLICFLSPDRQIKGDAFWNNWPKGKPIVQTFAGLVAYQIFLKPLGFCIVTLLLLIFLTKIGGAKGYRRAILISSVTMTVIYTLFYKLLIIPFPQGFLGL